MTNHELDRQLPNPPATLPPELLEQIDDAHTREGLVEGFIPPSLIYTADVPVDASRVAELKYEMRKEKEETGRRTGQLQPVLLGHIPDLGQLPIMDGFHRCSGFGSDEREEVLARIRPNTTWDYVIKHRIQNARKHDTVKFAREVMWMDQAWEMTNWAKKGITSIQAVSLATPKGSKGTNLGLDEDEIQAIKDWVGEMAENWESSTTTILRNLRVARLADPKLVAEARDKKSKTELTVVSPMHLDAIAVGLPNKYDLQNLVAEFAVEHNLSVPQTRKVVARVKESENIEEAREAVEDPEWKKATATKKPKRQTNIINAEANERLANILMTSELDFCRLAMEYVVVAGRYIPTLMKTDKPPIVFAPTEAPKQTEVFDWNRDQRERIGGWIGALTGPTIRGAGKAGISEDIARRLAGTTRERIYQDMEEGVLKYTGVQNSAIFKEIYSGCYKDELKLHKARTSHKGSSEVSIKNVKRRLVLDEKSFRNLISGIDDTQDSRMLTLSTVFGLPSMAIAQVLDINNPITVRGRLVKLTEQARLITSK